MNIHELRRLIRFDTETQQDQTTHFPWWVKDGDFKVEFETEMKSKKLLK